MPTLVQTLNIASPAAAPPSPKQQQPKLDALTSLRFFAAGMIFILHLFGTFDILVHSPLEHLALWQGVSFFFVLSGFILTYVYPEFKDEQAKVKFFVARFARIWPTYMASMVLYVALCPQVLTRPDIGLVCLVDVCMLQSWTLTKAFSHAINIPAWSISTEAFFYVMFPFLVSSLASTWKKKLLLCLGLVLLCIGVSAVRSYSLNFESFPPQISINPLCRIFEFMLGMVTCLFYRRYSGPVMAALGSAGATIAEILSVAAVFACLFIPRVWDYNPNNVIVEMIRVWSLFGGPCAVYGALIFLFACEKGAISKAISNRFFVMLGEISFSLYLFHAPIMIYLNDHIIHEKEGARFAAIIASIFISFIVSRLNFVLIEVPARHHILEAFSKVQERWLKGGKTLAESAVRKAAPFMPVWQKMEVVALVAAIGGISLFMYSQERKFRFVGENRVEQAMRNSRAEFHNVIFGDQFALRGLVEKRDKYGVFLKTTWQSLKNQKLTYMNAVHSIDDKGNTLAYSDYAQDPVHRTVRKDQFWQDMTFISNEKLKGATTLGIALYEAEPFHQLLVRNGPTDHSLRLLVKIDE